MKIWYMGLESYEDRYTLQLTDWNEREFKRLGYDYEIVTGAEIDSSKEIKVGQVLDAHGRTYYSMTQMANLIQRIRNGDVSGKDVIFFEDMFTPGMESLAYIYAQIPAEQRARIYVRCLAQTIDPDDFVNSTGMFPWMRHFELMLDNFISGILVASEEMVSFLRVAGFKSDIYVTGLPFGKEEVLTRVANVPSFDRRPNRVVYASRFDEEKQPWFLMDVIEKVKMWSPETEFAILTGSKELRSNRPEYVERARILEERGILTIREGLKKNEYYEELANSKILINTALQDWVSNTVSEADTFGCNLVFPAYRSFPETLFNDKDSLYIPWSVDSAVEKVFKQLRRPAYIQGKVSDYQNETIERSLCVMDPDKDSSEFFRGTKNYRYEFTREKA